MAATSNSSNQSLGEKREKYTYNHSHIPPVAMVDTLPEEEKWSTPWKLMVAKVGYQLLVNKIIVTYGDQGKAGADDDVRAFLIARLKETFGEQKALSKVGILFQGAKFLPRLIWGKITTDVVDVEDVMRDAIKTVREIF